MSPVEQAAAGGAIAGVVAAARALEAAGRDIVRLDIGEPAFETPEHIVEAGVKALRDGETRYVAPAGLAPLRDAIAEAARRRGIGAMAESVVVTSGAKPMLVYAMLATVRDGDEVLVPDPGYPGHAAAAALAGGRAVPYRLVDQDGGFRLDVDSVASRITTRTRALVINSPSNPTGSVLDDAELAAIAELATRHDLRVISDEVYAAISFGDAPPRSIAALPGMRERTIVVDSFSKTYAMTGWRLGHGVVPDELVERVIALVSDCSTCAPAFVQRAGLAALRGPQECVETMRVEYERRRGALAGGLAGAGFRARTAAGAFYSFPELPARRRTAPDGCQPDSATVASELLHRYGLACLPGNLFGRGGAGRLRLSFAAPREVIERGVERLTRWADDACR